MYEGVLKKFAKITGKQLRCSVFLTKLQAHSKFFTGDGFQRCLVKKKNLMKMYIFL